MSRKNGAVAAEKTSEADVVKRDKFNVVTTPAFGEEIRAYCDLGRVPFNQVAHAALREFLRRHPRWPGAPDPMPRGTRLKVHRR